MTPPKRETAGDVIALEASSLSPRGRIADAFGLISEQTRLQREALETEIKGQIIQWTLPVYEVQNDDSRLLVQTASYDGNVDISCVVPDPTPDDLAKAMQLEPGQLITCKGRIKGARFMTGLEISPAAIMW